MIKGFIGSDPNTISSDYEKGSLNAISRVFTESQLRACYFHFGQAIYRKIVDLGFKVKYHNDYSFSHKVRCFLALDFLPVADVVNGFEERKKEPIDCCQWVLSEDDNIPAEFLSYFELTYIGVMKGRASARRRLSPLFPIDIWNVKESTENFRPRTNNSVEGFHNALSNTLQENPPNVWKFIRRLHSEEILAKTKVLHTERGEQDYSKKKYKDVNTRLPEIMAKYDPEDKLSFLEGIAYNLHRF